MGTTRQRKEERKERRDPAEVPVFIFDFGGVVIKWKNNNPIFDHIADRYGIPRAEMRRVFELSLPRLETGEVSMEDYLGEALSGFEKRLRKGDSPDELWTLPFQRVVKMRAGTLRVVESLRKRGYPVYLFSNTSIPHARFLRRMGWDKLFDGFVSSCELRSMKPDAIAFERALAAIGADPSQVVFIDDREENVKGAKAYGIRWAFRFTSVRRLREDLAKVISAAPSRRPQRRLEAG